MKVSNWFILAGLFIIGSSERGAISAGPERGSRLFVSHFENVLGTSMELKVLASSEKQASVAESAALKEIGRLGKILSAYDAGSEFSAWFRTRGQAVRVSPELFEVLDLFDQWRVRSGGALDASAEVIGKLWKTASAQQRLPSQTELDQAVEEVRQPHWRLDAASGTATHLSQAPLMLNSFAKSYIIRKAADAAMGSEGVRAVVLNIGGDLVVSGDLKETVQISDPKSDAENDPPVDRLQVNNRAVATSGNYRRGEQIDGRWYSHIVDPRTGHPADEVISATVVAPKATDAGALATVFNVLSPAESVGMGAKMPGVDYLIITRSGQRIESKGWKLLEIKDGEGKDTGGKNQAGPGDVTRGTPSVPGDVNRGTPAGPGDVTRGTPAGPAWANDFVLEVNLEINLQKEGFVKRPYVAVWVEDENHAPLRTIAVWHQNDRYLPELKSWYLKYRELYATDKAVLGSVSSATRSAGKYIVKWDGKDDKGNFVSPGKYTIKIEAAREHGTYQLMRQELVCDETPKIINITGNVEIASAVLVYRKKNSGD